MAQTQIIVHLEDPLREGVVRWAKDEERSTSAQVRKVLKDAIPAEYLATEDETPA